MDLSSIIALGIAAVMVAAVVILFRLFAPRPPKSLGVGGFRELTSNSRDFRGESDHLRLPNHLVGKIGKSPQVPVPVAGRG